MKRVVTVLAVLSLATLSWADNPRLTATNRLQSAGQVINSIMAAPDNGIPDEVLEHAKCIAVVPTLVKGGFIFGGEGGAGVASCRTDHGWSAPAFFTIAGGSWGLQIGLEGVSLVMVFQNQQGMQELLSSKFQLGAGGSVAAGPVGRHASADTDWKMNAEILTYSRAKGVFAGLTLHGAVVSRDNSEMDAFYNPDTTTRAVLMGRVASPQAASPFIDAIHKAEHQAEISK
ncbi:MAG TPA: lipid-binding SYLF domain-containing protein [Terracidiphilus sp.]|nr:lipid-binding SYLF domain-containing protein [Terracidiphilus sp.]